MTGRSLGALLLTLAVGAAVLTVGRTEAAFNSSPVSGHNAYSVAPDFVAPTVVRTRAADPANGPSYAVQACRFYHAYAEVADTGNPASGVASVTAGLGDLTAGVEADPLVAGSYSLDGLSYGWRSLPRLATAAPGSYGYDLTSSDNAGNSRREGDFGVAVSAPAGLGAVFLTGLEQGVISAPGVFDTVVGTGVSADGGVRRHGSYSLRVAPNYASAYATADLDGSGSTAVVRFAMRLAALPTTTANLFAVSVSGGATVSTAILLYDAPGGVFAVRWGMSGSVVLGTVAPDPGTWQVIEMRVSVASPHVLEWRIDAVDQPTASAANPAQSVVAVNFGTGFTNVSYTANFDDVIVSRTAADYPIGNGMVLALAPDGMGAHNRADRFRNNDNTSIDAASWTRVDEVPATSSADYVKQTTRNNASYVEFTFADTAETCINAVGALVAYHSADTATSNGKASIFSGAVESVVYSGDMSGTTLRYRRAVVSPAGGAWTASLVSALVARVGYSTDVNPNPYWDALLLEYDVPVDW